MKIHTAMLTAQSWNHGEPQEPGSSCTFFGRGYRNVTSMNTLFKIAKLSQEAGKTYRFTIEEVEV